MTHCKTAAVPVRQVEVSITPPYANGHGRPVIMRLSGGEAIHDFHDEGWMLAGLCNTFRLGGPGWQHRTPSLLIRETRYPPRPRGSFGINSTRLACPPLFCFVPAPCCMARPYSLDRTELAFWTVDRASGHIQGGLMPASFPPRGRPPISLPERRARSTRHCPHSGPAGCCIRAASSLQLGDLRRLPSRGALAVGNCDSCWLQT